MVVNLTDLVQALSERQQATEGQLKALADTLKALEAQVAGFSPAAARPAAAPVAAPAAAKQAASPEKGKVTPEVLVMIAAAVWSRTATDNGSATERTDRGAEGFGSPRG